jgi:hypothetical protein
MIDLTGLCGANKKITVEIEIIAEKSHFPVYTANGSNWKERLDKANAKFPQANYSAWRQIVEIEKLE